MGQNWDTYGTKFGHIWDKIWTHMGQNWDNCPKLIKEKF